MNYAPSLDYIERQDINMSDIFNGQYYSSWNTRMKIFIQSKDYEL